AFDRGREKGPDRVFAHANRNGRTREGSRIAPLSQEKESMRKIIFIAAALAAAIVAAEEHSIIQKNRLFSQQEISLRPGEAVKFQNADEVMHNVFSVTPGME